MEEQQHNRPPPPRKRRRPALSCVSCRQRKIRCDRTQPCKNCASALVQCLYQPFVNSPVVTRHPPGVATNAGAGSDLQHRSSTANLPPAAGSLAHLVGQSNYPIVSQLEAAARENVSPGVSSSNVRTQSHGATGSGLDLRYQILKDRPADPPLQPGLDESGWHILKQQVGLKDSDVPLNKHRPPRWSEWLGTAPEFSTIYSCYVAASGGDGSASWFQDAETAALIPRISELLQRAKAAAVKIKSSRPSRASLQIAATDLIPPARDVADAMVELYFQSFESTYRILHRRSFRQDYEKFWASPNTAPASLRLKVLLVVAIGASIHKDIDNDPRFYDEASRWICAAQDWLLAPSEKARLDITGIQIHCLTFLARQIYSSSADLVWISVGNMINAAVQLGLHRDPKYVAATSPFQAELRRRLWATIVEMEMQTAMDTAMAVRIRVDDFDTEPPSHVNDHEIGEETTEIRAHPRAKYTETSLQLLLVDTRPIRLQILQLLNGLHSKFLYADALALSKELTNAHRPFSKFIQDNSRSGLTAFHRNLLDYCVCRFLIPLHGPFASKARTNPLFHYSRRVGVDAAMAIVSPEPSEPYTRLMTLGGNLLREGLRCAITAINLDLVIQADSDRLDGTLHRPSPFTEPLRKAVKDMMALSEEQIKKHETNVKLHSLLASILALIDAGSDVSVKKRVAQAAIDSLEHCLGLLQSVAETIPTPTSSSASSIDFDPGEWDLDWNMDMLMPDIGGFWEPKSAAQANGLLR
ncbi:hypothetical protein MRB53_041255 [Persea americana]|nr:hypothetical protein MRB53_041255 [Persea americana]